MSREQIKQIVASRSTKDGIVETGIEGVQIYRLSQALRCAPAVYEPTVVAIVSGSKEAILDGKRFEFDSSKYMCVSMSMPVEAGTPDSSPENPLLVVNITIDTRLMSELVMEMDRAEGAVRKPKGDTLPQGFAVARWDEGFTDALLRLLQLGNSPADRAILGRSRLRELYYAILRGEAGDTARRAFGMGNEIARAIEYLSTRLDEAVTIDDLASQVGMSRAVFHRKFKEATSMPPIQFVKSMKLNNAAMMIAGGMTVNEAAQGVGYVSSSQFSREFKRLYGSSPKQWSHSRQAPMGTPVRSAQLYNQIRQSAV